MTQYSHSRLSAFENCPRQFHYRYVEKVEIEEEGIEAFVGKRVHEILERLYHHVARYGRPPTVQQVRDRFDKDWGVNWHDQVRVIREEFGLDFYRGLGIRCLENYYRSHYPFDHDETVGVEHPVTLSLDPGGRYRLRGIVDRISRRRAGRYEIHDYKTSATLPPRARLDRNRQLPLYQIGLEQSYDDVEEVDLFWHYLTFNRTFQFRRTPDQLDALRSETMKLIDRIEAESDFKANPGPLCRWCEYRGLCPDATTEAREIPAPPLPKPKPRPTPGPDAEPGRPVQLSLPFAA